MKKINKFVTFGTLVAIVIAILLGLFAPTFTKSIAFIGTYIVKALKIIVGPVIFTSISLTILNRKKSHSFLIGKTVALFLIMFISTFLLSTLVVVFAKPGTGFFNDKVYSNTKQANFGIGSIFLNLFPKSFKDLVLGSGTFFVIICALLTSFCVSKTQLAERYSFVMGKCKKFVDAILTIIVCLTPLMVLSLLSNMIATYDVTTFKIGLKYLLFAYGLSILAIIIIMILPVWIIAKINPITYIKKACKVWVMTITTCSSAATLPYTIKICNEEFNVDEKITDVVVPLGCTIHMCGGAVSFSLLGLFVAQLNGVPVTFGMYLLMLASATLINMAAPGIPGGGVVIGFTYLNLLKLPVEGFYGLYAAMYKLLDMSYTTLNVTGDVSANIILNHFENKKSMCK